MKLNKNVMRALRGHPIDVGVSSDISLIVRLWLLRMLVPLGGHREFINQRGFSNDLLAESLGLGNWVDPVDPDFDSKAVRTALRKLYQKGEREFMSASLPACLTKNVARLSTLVGLSGTDARILEFAVVLHNERILDDTADGPVLNFV